jgi:molybdate transport system substrate-binding protein
MIRRLVYPMVLLLLVALAACSSRASASGPTAAPTTLTVFAAASLTEAFQDLGPAFEAQHPSVKVAFNLGGSQDLRTQIDQGARVDVFASADTKNMDALQTAKRNVQVFVHNRLVVIVPKANPAGVQRLQDLAKPGLKLDVADASVPVGAYSLQMLDKLSASPAYGADFKDQVLARVVSKESDVKQVVSKVSLGEADAGIVYTTDAQAAANQLTEIAVPDQFNVIATYPIAVLATSAHPALAQQFVDFVLSAQGQTILQKYGFAPA